MSIILSVTFSSFAWNGDIAPSQISSAISISHGRVICTTSSIRVVMSHARFLVTVVSTYEMDHPNKLSSPFKGCRRTLGRPMYRIQDINTIEAYNDRMCSELVGCRLTTPLCPSFHTCRRLSLIYITLLEEKWTDTDKESIYPSSENYFQRGCRNSRISKTGCHT